MKKKDAAKKTAAKTKKKTPAQKAWETMRERYTDEQISERQREAAKKAWETRRANARKRTKAVK